MNVILFLNVHFINFVYCASLKYFLKEKIELQFWWVCFFLHLLPIPSVPLLRSVLVALFPTLA